MRRPQFDLILDVLSTRWGHSIDAIFKPGGGKMVSEWRMIFLYVAYNFRIPNVVITEYFHEKGHKINHASISNAIARLRMRLHTDEILNDEIAIIIAECLQRMRYGKGQ